MRGAAGPPGPATIPTGPAGGGSKASTAASKLAGPTPRGESGQASVEVVALAPVIALVVVGLAIGLQAHAAGEAAGLAAHAAGLAAMQGRDPEDAAREAVPDVARDRLRVQVDGATIRVRVRASGPRALVGSFDAERRVVARPVGGR